MFTCERRKYCEGGLEEDGGRAGREEGWMEWGSSGYLVGLSWHSGFESSVCVCWVVKEEEVQKTKEMYIHTYIHTLNILTQSA